MHFRLKLKRYEIGTNSVNIKHPVAWVCQHQLSFLSHFHDFPGPRPDFRTFQAWKMWLLNSRTLQDLYEPCTQQQQPRQRDNQPVRCSHQSDRLAVQTATTFGWMEASCTTLQMIRYCRTWCPNRWCCTRSHWRRQRLRNSSREGRAAAWNLPSDSASERSSYIII